ncbi:hypothetical protein ZYGR_0AI06870 [Zygosaccharomyces rouxii]|uniref:HMG box domain-containing protein n=1 Tax=Zygosaccharomyces rouxii TaxID=4956 RepID=A0A1Q3AD24_ZYGRO|nr:hypothetical protein ZYGR_0AI06870 [Zygosaccharomyces rouxii]
MSEKKIPRPRNAFILFRQHHHRLLIDEWTAQGVDIPHNSKISKILGVRWKSLNEQERSHWEEQARKEKCEHEKKYPDYRYKPTRRHRRKGSKQIPLPNGSPHLPIHMTLQHPNAQRFHSSPTISTQPHPHSTPLSTVTKGVSSPVQQPVGAMQRNQHVHPPPPALAPQLTPMHNLMAPGPAAGQLRPLPYPMAPANNPATTGATAHHHPAHHPAAVYPPYYLPLQGFLPKFSQVPSSQVAQATPPNHHAQVTMTPQPPPGATGPVSGVPTGVPSGVPSGVPPPSLPSSLPPATAIPPSAIPHIPAAATATAIAAPTSISSNTANVKQEGGRAGTLPFSGGEHSPGTHNWQWRGYAYPFDRR